MLTERLFYSIKQSKILSYYLPNTFPTKPQYSMMDQGKMPLGKNDPRKIAPQKIVPYGNCLLENWPPENCPPGKFPPENWSPWNFFVNFFLSLIFIFMRIFDRKKNLFLFNSFFYYKYQFVYSIFFNFFSVRIFLIFRHGIQCLSYMYALPTMLGIFS